MAFDEGLAQRIREELEDDPGLTEKKMFGGIGFMLHGNLACGVIQDEMIVRVGPDAYGRAVKKKHARPFDFTGKPMKGWLYVAPDGYESDRDLRAWVALGADFARSLPKK